MFNPLNAKLNPICHLLALLWAHPILHVSRIRANREEYRIESTHVSTAVSLPPNWYTSHWATNPHAPTHFIFFSFFLSTDPNQLTLIDVDMDEGKQLAEIPHRTAATENRHLRKHYNPSQHNTHITDPPPSPATISVIVIIKPTDDEISPSLQNRIDFVNTNTLSDENLMMAGLGRNM